MAVIHMKSSHRLLSVLLCILTGCVFASTEPLIEPSTTATPIIAKQTVATSEVARHTAELKPYQARYHTKAMGLGMTLKRSLSSESGIYTLKNTGKIFVVGISEQAHFTVEAGVIQGIDFVYKLTGIVKRRREVQFDPEQGVIRSLKKTAWTEHSWQPEILDRLSQQEALRLALMNAEAPPKLLEFTVIDGARVRTRQLEWVANEKLATEVGELDTVHYRQIREDAENRASDIWLATDFDYLMVRTRHIEDGSPIEITLIDAVLDDSAVIGRTW